MAGELYWLTFRLADNASWQQRYDALKIAVSGSMDGTVWWDEPTSFLLFRSNLAIDDLATVIAEAIDLRTDVALLGMPDYKSARVVGSLDDPDIFKLWPWVKQA